MGFLRKNSGKVALVVLIAFFTLPFIYGNQEEEDFSPFAVKSGMPYQANPISRLADRIASFYGFSRPSAGDRTSAIKGKVAAHHVFNKESSSAGSTSQDNTLLASSKRYSSDKSSSTQPSTTSAASTSYANAYSKSNSPVKGYVKVNGNDYKVIEDAKGEKYVVTPKGHVPYRELVQNTVSEQEFLAAKKRMPNANDIEILQTLQKEKAKNTANTPAAPAYQNYQANAYRTGTAGNMGGSSAISASLKDKGFDDNALSDAYANLKNINLNIEVPSSATGGSSGGVYDGGSRGSSATSQTGDGDLTPQGIASQAKAAAQQEIGVKKDEPEETSQEEQNSETVIMSVKKNGDSSFEIVNSADDADMVFIRADKGSEYEIWGQAGSYKFSKGESFGVIAPIKIIKTRRGRSLDVHDPINDVDENIKKSVDSIKGNIDNIVNLVTDLSDEKIYIDTSTMDEFSRALLTENNLVNRYTTNNPEEASIILQGPICTPESFNQFVKELEKQKTKLLAGKEDIPAA